jgi:hypothetical protein
MLSNSGAIYEVSSIHVYGPYTSSEQLRAWKRFAINDQEVVGEVTSLAPFAHVTDSISGRNTVVIAVAIAELGKRWDPDPGVGAPLAAGGYNTATAHLIVI